MRSRPLVIRNGLVIDGTGAPAVRADVAVRDGVIAEVGRHVDATAAEVIDADGLVVTPGFVDIHTHYDGQATWDPVLAPSSVHGVTSLVMGNCGVGFAPAHPTAEQHDWLIGMLEGVEDIPGTALAEGLAWDWETFPDYLDALGRRALRPRRRHARHARPAAGLRDGRAGRRPHGVANRRRAGGDGAPSCATVCAPGPSGSRPAAPTPTGPATAHPSGTRFSSEDELRALIGAMGETGAGVVQMISDAYLSTDDDFAREEMALMRSLVEHSGRPLSMTVQQVVQVPDRWREMAEWVAAAVADGLPMRTQVAPRPVGVLQGLQASVNPVAVCPSYQEIAQGSLAETRRRAA